MTMTLPENFTKFDTFIKSWAEHFLLPWRLIKAQIWQESAFDQQAKSDHGAMGLMQLMPDTAREMGLDTHEVFDPEWNIYAGIKYDKIQFDHFLEIPEIEQKISFMLAAYNGGRGYINLAIEKSYESQFGETLSKSHRGGLKGIWQTWSGVAPFLYSVEIGTKRPDADQIINYVDRIWEKYHQL
jgi:hypothetical protein